MLSTKFILHHLFAGVSFLYEIPICEHFWTQYLAYLLPEKSLPFYDLFLDKVAELLALLLTEA